MMITINMLGKRKFVEEQSISCNCDPNYVLMQPQWIAVWLLKMALFMFIWPSCVKCGQS